MAEAKVLTKKDVQKAALTWFVSSHMTYNYQRLQAGAMTSMLGPVFQKLYGDNKEKIIEGCQRQMLYFNTEPRWGAIIPGMVVALEEAYATDPEGGVDGGLITEIKTALMGPLAGIGDVVSQSIVYPILAGVCIQLALAGNYAGPILFEIIYKAIMLTLGYNMYMLGYKQGKSAIISFLKTGVLNQILDLVSIVGLMVVGSMAVNNISYNLSLIGWEVQNEIGSVSFNLQTTVLDALLPGILPLGLVLGVRALLKKRVKPNTIILIMFVLAFVTVGLGALCGAYR